MTHVSILVCTRDRVEPLRRCCESIGRLKFRRIERPEVDVVVVDNTRHGTPGVDGPTLGRLTGVPTAVVVEPRPGIPFARNTAIDRRDTGATFVAFVDDDETVAPSWLEHLLVVAANHDADFVAGPCLPHLPEGTDPAILHWFALHRGLRAETGTRLPAAATGNLLVRTSFLDRTGLRFDESIGTGGGSDTDFTTRAATAGAGIVWADRAIVWEHIPARRATWRWIAATARKDGATKERYAQRLGQAHGAGPLVRRLAADLRDLAGLDDPAARMARRVTVVADTAGRAGALVGHAPRYYRRRAG